MEKTYSDGGSTDRRDSFLRLFTRNQSRIYSYIISLLGNLNDSEDVFQETASAMWHSFDKYEQGTDFAAWGIRIARNKAIDHIRKMQRNKVFYSCETLRLISDYQDCALQFREQRTQALQECLAKLSARDQTLIRMRYGQQSTVKSLAEHFDRSVNAIYKAFSRIHFALYRCIRRQMEKA